MKQNNFRAHCASIRALVAEHRWEDALFDAARLRARPLKTLQRLTLEALVHNWVAVIDAAEGLEFDDHSKSTKTSHITALIQLGFLQQALVQIRDAQKLFPNHLPLQQQKSQCLQKMGRIPAALKVEKSRWQANEVPAVLDVTSLLLQQDRVGACATFLKSAKSRAKKTAPHFWYRSKMRLFEVQGRIADATRYIGLVRDHSAENLGQAIRWQSQFAVRHNHKDLQQDAMQHLQAWIENPKQRYNLIEHGPIILRAQWRFTPGAQQITDILAALEMLLLPETPARVLRDVLMQMGDYDRAAALLEHSLLGFASSVPLWRETLRLRARMGQSGHCADLRHRIFAALPEQAALDAICHNHTNAWDMGDLPRMIRHGYNTPTFRVREVFKAAMQRLPDLSTDALTALKAQHDKVDPIDALGITLLSARQSQRARLHQAEKTPVPFDDFVRDRNDLHTSIRQGRNQILNAAENATRMNPGQALIVECVRLIAKVQQHADVSMLNTAESVADAVDVARWLSQRIQSGTATSVLRLGDGEGHFLPFNRALTGSLQQDKSAMMELWWNNSWPDAATERRVVQQFRRAVAASDMLGLVPESRLLRINQTYGKVVTSNRGLARVMDFAATHPYPKQILTSAQFHRDLVEWGLWDDILAAIPKTENSERQVSWIAPHDLAPFLQTRFGLKTRQAVIIPGEAKYAGMFDPETAISGSLITQHEHVRASLAPRKGEVWLVAAGFLGKVYCHRIRTKGGIAIDIGSLADDWKGYATRVYQSDINQIRPPESLSLSGYL